MKYARDIAAIAGGMMIGYAMRLEGAAHWMMLIAGATIVAAVLAFRHRGKV